jgi:hypothetical protein
LTFEGSQCIHLQGQAGQEEIGYFSLQQQSGEGFSIGNQFRGLHINSKVTPRSQDRDLEYCLLSEEWNPV